MPTTPSRPVRLCIFWKTRAWGSLKPKKSSPPWKTFLSGSPASRRMPCAGKRKKEAGRNETLGGFSQYSCQGHAHLLPETAQRELGPDISPGMDGDVFHQDGQRPGQHPHSASRRGGALHSVRLNISSCGDRDL